MITITDGNKTLWQNKTSLTQTKRFYPKLILVQNWSLDVIKGTYPDRFLFLRTLYRLDHWYSKEEDLPWKAKENQMVIAKNEGKQVLLRDLREETNSHLILRRIRSSERGYNCGRKHKSAVIVTLVERCSKAIITLKTNGR